ncbi:probable RNA-dependent RNA polymerase 1 [Aristolochia californica]|uniref:probable RNA-dependent RNA polymerase 1 n=1 Tax=Aristolochia californica TaxID=171875 RepID=UPI0035D5D0BD
MGGKTIQVCNLPISATAQMVKEFLETHTGEGTVLAMKIRTPNKLGRIRTRYAVVQFTTSKCAEDICSKTLLFNFHLLKFRNMERDIVPRPKTLDGTLERASLFLGHQVSGKEFMYLWLAEDVRVHFGHGLKKLEFFLSYDGIQYRLDLFYGSIWQIQLRCPTPQVSKFLVIQMQSSPRIYKKDPYNSGQFYDDPLLNYFRDTSDEQWIRTVDFTPFSSIGQSSSLCVQVASDCKLPDIRRNFFYYRKDDGEFMLRLGSPTTCTSNLVPVVESSAIHLPYGILFKVNSLVQNGILIGPTLDVDFYNLVDPRSNPRSYIDNALESLYHMKDSCFEPAKYLQEKYEQYKTSSHPTKPVAFALDSGLVYIHRVQVTPSKVYFCGPEVNVSNRVVRQYPDAIDNFLRVSFIDEDSDKIRSTDLVPRSVLPDGEKHTDVYKRILSILKNGIVIGDKVFEFLAFSSSQLRENSLWMFASRSGLSAADIREWMGDFSDIRNVAKYAARLGQSFGSSKEILSVERHEIEIISDVEIEIVDLIQPRKYTFSDGIGKISPDLAKKVASKCDLKRSTPSAFQIRYGGYKGVVAVDPKSMVKLSLRKSMYKYNSDNTKLDVLAWSKYLPCFLNRQLITLLSTLGVEDQIFEMKQKEALDQLDAILIDPDRAQEALEVMSPGENTRVLREMLLCGYMPDAEPFLSMMLQTFRAFKLLELRTKSRIYVPNGRLMMGCLDETGTLDYGQVFVKASSVRPKQFFEMYGTKSCQGSSVIEGTVVVAKNPCLHPGDVRVLTAVDVPDLHHMVDCVVFPQKGKRPHPNECSGSDLDGDLYFVCWDPEFIPPRQISPMDYDAAPAANVDHDVLIEEVEEYFTNYMVNDSLGVISNAHTAFADKETLMAESGACLQLAELFSIAVDFPKTGIPAEIPARLHVKEYPDFMEKRDKPTYESTRVIGKLYRAVKDISSHVDSFTMEVARRSYDPDMEVDGFENYIADACYYKGMYDYKLGSLMDHYGIKTEAEIISGNILSLSRSFMRNKDADAVGQAVRSLKKKARRWFDEIGTQADPHAIHDADAKASACYHVTYHTDYWGNYSEGSNRAHFLSFAWIFCDKLIAIKKKNKKGKKHVKKTVGEESLYHDFGLNLRIR